MWLVGLGLLIIFYIDFLPDYLKTYAIMFAVIAMFSGIKTEERKETDYYDI